MLHEQHNMQFGLQMAVDMVVEPDSIETTVDDIGGLDNILESLVSCTCCTHVLVVQTVRFLRAQIAQTLCRCPKLRPLCCILTYSMEVC